LRNPVDSRSKRSKQRLHPRVPEALGRCALTVDVRRTVQVSKRLGSDGTGTEAVNAVTFDTHAAVRKPRAANRSEQQAEALVDVFSHAIGEPATRTDLHSSATGSPSASRRKRISPPSRRG
jgi:hypothetical protein